MRNTAKISELNDNFRKTGRGGKIITTAGVLAQSDEIMREVMEKIKTFEDFTEGDDPYGEHDFGAVVHDGQKYFFKIDCYDKDFECGSEDPANALITNRVLTIMLAEEY